MGSRTVRIGRYEVVGQLAMGGMAEILLGRLLGPSGFERVVVIKRILPNLAQHVSFTSMFLDEARIAAAIHHPNVVQVHELGEEEGDLFLVMEYLQGENLSGLLRRLTIVGEGLPPALAAHIGAQACAGLHAAHELHDAEGRSIGLVHRDISPQNVFVTYDGAVKILDFGVAKAADRITQTEAGTLKGKFAYMSPEQCVGETPDRRSDIFSLGIVLYEAVTGRRLFDRPGQLKTLRAVVEEPFPRPSELRPDLPPELEGVILRALERERDARFATAAEMRRALAEAAAHVEGPTVPEEALASLMQRLFPDRIEEKSAMLQRVRAGSELTAVPPADIDIDVEVPSVAFEPEWSTPTVSPPTVRAGVTAARRRHGRRWLAAAGTVVAVLLAGLAWVMAGRDGGPAQAEDAASPPAVSDDRQPAVRGPEGPVTPSAPHAPSGVVPGEPPPERVTLRIDSRPSGADVVLEGEPRGVTPVEVELEASGEPLDLHVRRGRLEHTQTIIPDRHRDVQLILAGPARRGRRRAPSTGEPAQPPEPAGNDFARFD